jgi:Bacterial regulatory proteins, tetR family
MARTPKITNEAILAVAQQLFLEQGEKASTLEIANKAGISEASIFKRFATKQALFLAAIGITAPPPVGQRSTPSPANLSHKIGTHRTLPRNDGLLPTSLAPSPDDDGQKQ